MRHFLITSALSLAIGCAGLSLLGGVASAQDFEFSIGQIGPRVKAVDRCDPELEFCQERRDSVDRPVMRGCTEGRALDKAERMGINRARVVSAGRRTIEVRGRTPDGDRTYVTFSRRSGCPVLE